MDGVGSGVPEGEAPGDREGVGVGEGDAEGQRRLRTVCPLESVKNTPAAEGATPQGALSIAAPEARPSMPPVVPVPAIVITVVAAGGMRRRRLLEASATIRFPTLSSFRSLGLKKRAFATEPSAQLAVAVPETVITAAVA
jgi:hypothetical protein